MSRIVRSLTRRTFLLSLLTLAAFKKRAGMDAHTKGEGTDTTVLAGGWLLKKSDLS